MLVQAASPAQLKAGELLSSMKNRRASPTVARAGGSAQSSMPSCSGAGNLTIMNPDEIPGHESGCASLLLARRLVRPLPRARRLTSSRPPLVSRSSVDGPSTPWDSEVDRIVDARCLDRAGGSGGGSGGDDDERSQLHAAVLAGDLAYVRCILTATTATTTSAAQSNPLSAAVAAAIETESLVASSDGATASAGGESAAAVGLAVESAAMEASVPVRSPAPSPAAAPAAPRSAVSLATAGSAASANIWVNVADHDGVAPLLTAVALGTVKMEAGGETSEPSEVEAVVLELVALLLEHGARADATDGMGNTALHWATFRGHGRVVAALARHPCEGARLVAATNASGETALHWASRIGAVAIARTLIIDHGALLRCRNAESLCPLDVACRGLMLQSSASGEKEGEKGSVEEAVGVPPQEWEARSAMRQCLYWADPRCRTLVLTHEDCLGHLPRSQQDWECPERVVDVMAGVRDAERFHPDDGELEVSSDFDKAPAEMLARAHSKEYIKFVTDLAKRMSDMVTQDPDGRARPVPFTPQVPL